MKHRKTKYSQNNSRNEKFLKALQQEMTMAVAHHQAGRLQQAEAIYAKVLAVKPDHVDAIHLSGVAAHHAGQHQKAADLILRAIRVSPKVPMFFYNLGAAYHAMSFFQEAIQSYQTALDLDPGYAEVHSNLGNSYKSLGKMDEAISSYQKAIQLKPNFADAYNNLGTAFSRLGQFENAMACFRKSLSLNPTSWESYHNVGNLCKDAGRLSESLEWYQKALAIHPGHPETTNNIGVSMQLLGKVSDAVACYDAALKIKPDYASAHSNKLLALHYDHSGDWASLFQEHLSWDIQHGSVITHPTLGRRACRNAHEKIHVGYLSPDFKQHSVTRFIEPILKTHDSRRFNVTCYSDTPYPDHVTHRLKRFGWEWRDTSGISNNRLFEQIQSDQIQILVDLAGHTANNRMSLLAQKPAPIQVTYLGYPNTTGLQAMDYRITDAVADPPGLTDRWHTEKLIRVPGSFLCYQAPAGTPEPSVLPSINANGITFASFNNRAKITASVIRTWAAILESVPNARLILKSKALEDPGVCQQLIAQFDDCHVDPKRLELYGFLPPEKHMGLYHRVDVALDTFPYNGTTTTCDALWMGVPVIVLEGDNHVSRVGVSLLTSTGLNAFIAHSVDDYIHKAIKLSQDTEMLSSTRYLLRKMMRDSPLMNAESLTRSLETAYESMWRDSTERQR